MEVFDEKLFVWALTTRPEDAKTCITTFNPEWLNTTEAIPIVREIYAFTKLNGVPPSIPTLQRIFKDRDPEIYNLRIAPFLDSLATMNPDVSEVLHCLGRVKDVAIIRSFQDLSSNQLMLHEEAGLNGKAVLARVAKWVHQFSTTTDEETMSIRDSVEKVVETSGTDRAQYRIPVHIKVIDDWTNQGLRTGQLGIFMAPTGGGKSVLLLNMAYKAADVGLHNVWFVTNELTMFTQTERFMSRLTHNPVNEIEDEPILGYKGLDQYWSRGLDKKLWITATTREQNVDELESIMLRQRNLYGWKPQLIVIDYMERMKPNDSGYSRDKEWHWYGAVARDLRRMAMRHNILIWTACQSNRAGLNAQILESSMGQGSIRHFQEADALIAGRQVSAPGQDEEGETNIAIEFFNLKARGAKLHSKSRILSVDLKNMYISNIEVEQEMIKRETPAQLQVIENAPGSDEQKKYKPRFGNGNSKSKRRPNPNVF